MTRGKVKCFVSGRFVILCLSNKRMSTAFQSFYIPQPSGSNVDNNEYDYLHRYVQPLQQDQPSYFPALQAIPSASSSLNSNTTGFNHETGVGPEGLPIYMDTNMLAGSTRPLDKPFHHTILESGSECHLSRNKGYNISKPTHTPLLFEDEEEASFSASSSASSFHTPSLHEYQQSPVQPLSLSVQSGNNPSYPVVEIPEQDQYLAHPTAPLPSLEDTEPLFVNAKQYHRIVKRRRARARLAELHRLSHQRKVS